MVGLVDDDERVRRGVATLRVGAGSTSFRRRPPSASDARGRPARKWRHQHVHALHNMLDRLARRDDEPLADKERQRFVSRHEKDRRIGIFIQHLHHTLDSNKGLPTARGCEQAPRPLRLALP